MKLPLERVEERESKPENIVISVSKNGDVFWQGARVKSPRALIDQLKTVSQLKPQPEVQIRGDMDAQYEGVGRVMYAAQVAGIAKVAFITEPPGR